MTDPDGQGPPGQGPPGQGPPGQPEPGPELDLDSVFAAIIAGFSASPPSGDRPWPASEDLDDPDPSAPDPFSPSAERPRAVDRPGARPADGENGPREGAHRRIVLPDASSSVDDEDDEDDEDEDERYVPPIPPPIPRGDLVVRLAWASVLGGPLFLLVAALTWRTLPSFLLFVALLAFIGGFVTLVARMPADRPDDPDDGAVV